MSERMNRRQFVQTATLGIAAAVPAAAQEMSQLQSGVEAPFVRSSSPSPTMSER